MNARGFTNGGLTSTSTFWKVSIPLVVASIIVPVAFSGLLIRKTMQIAFELKAQLNSFMRLLYSKSDLLSYPLLTLYCLWLGATAICPAICSIPQFVEWMVCGGDDDDGLPGRPGCVILALKVFRILKERCTKKDEGHNGRQSFSNDNEGVSNEDFELA